MISQNPAHRITVFQLLILVLSVYVIIALCADAFLTLPKEVSELIEDIDALICVVFLGDFFYRFFRAENKLSFMKWGWIDLISSIPMLDVLRVGRLARIIRLLRVLRIVRSGKVLFTHMFANRKLGTFSAVGSISLVLMIFSSITILMVETDPEANIRTAEDALWWSFVTITTVGYGDKYPLSTEGRLIAGVLILAGVGLFGTFTGFVASWFMEDSEQKPGDTTGPSS